MARWSIPNKGLLLSGSTLLVGVVVGGEVDDDIFINRVARTLQTDVLFVLPIPFDGAAFSFEDLRLFLFVVFVIVVAVLISVSA